MGCQTATTAQPPADTFDADLQRSEGLRQSDFATAQAKVTNNWNSAFVPQDAKDAFTADMRAAQVAHLRRIYASALANGRDVAGPLSNLREIGAGA